jgi:hypothetical protein
VKLNRASLVAGLAFVALAAGLVPTELSAGQAQITGQRVVTGYVVDAGSTPLVGATVFLKNLKTKSIRSFTSVADGKFRFAQVSMVEDHELWAEKDGKKSAVKTVSTWDARKEFEVELKLK